MNVKTIGKRIKIIRGPRSLNFGPTICRSGSWLIIGSNRLRLAIRTGKLPNPNNVLFLP